MNCLEYFIKGNPEQFEKLRFEQRCQMTHYLELLPLEETGGFADCFLKSLPLDYFKNTSVELAVRYGTRFGKTFGYWCLQNASYRSFSKTTVDKCQDIPESEKDQIVEAIGGCSRDPISEIDLLEHLKMWSEEKETMSEIQFTELLKEQEVRCYFQYRHDWPTEEKIKSFISKDKTIKRTFGIHNIQQPMILYNHKLALRLWEARKRLNWVDQKVYYRRVGLDLMVITQ